MANTCDACGERSTRLTYPAGGLWPEAPVNAPFSWPKSSDAMSDAGIAAQLMLTKGEAGATTAVQASCLQEADRAHDASGQLLCGSMRRYGPSFDAPR